MNAWVITVKCTANRDNVTVFTRLFTREDAATAYMDEFNKHYGDTDSYMVECENLFVNDADANVARMLFLQDFDPE